MASRSPVRSQDGYFLDVLDYLKSSDSLWWVRLAQPWQRRRSRKPSTTCMAKTIVARTPTPLATTTKIDVKVSSDGTEKVSSSRPTQLMRMSMKTTLRRPTTPMMKTMPMWSKPTTTTTTMSTRMTSRPTMPRALMRKQIFLKILKILKLKKPMQPTWTHAAD